MLYSSGIVVVPDLLSKYDKHFRYKVKSEPWDV